jgi:two-component system, NtrC family, sensor histidine kinase HydH
MFFLPNTVEAKMKNSNKLRIGIILLFIISISLFHYLTPLHLHSLHDIFQRFYYLPIILSALWYGIRGGLACSLLVSIVYAPHILFQWGESMVIGMEKYLEMVLYNVVGGVTGLLAQREQEKSQELQKTAEGLEVSYKKLQQQSDRIIAVEEKLRRAEKLSTLGEMSAVLAHEIRNPLGSIRGTAEILRDDYKPGDPKFEFIEIQIRETERLNRVVEDFLRMSKPHPPEMHSCSVIDELETVVTLTCKDAAERKVAVTLQDRPGLPDVSGDGEKLRQAFLNIIINALQATPANGRVDIDARQVGSNLEIRFRDTGQGIDPESLKRVFEPFFTTRVEGTGLGLAITKKIIESHGGTLDLESEIGKGTTVIVCLPVK